VDAESLTDNNDDICQSKIGSEQKPDTKA